MCAVVKFLFSTGFSFKLNYRNSLLMHVRVIRKNWTDRRSSNSRRTYEIALEHSNNERSTENNEGANEYDLGCNNGTRL